MLVQIIDDPSRKSGYRLVGDVDFEQACKVLWMGDSVRGGVGPMTVAMLLKNTLDGAKAGSGKEPKLKNKHYLERKGTRAEMDRLGSGKVGSSTINKNARGKGAGL
ncbi:hypothetical protein IFM89_012105 [Coptis chinensis]|uniref:Tetrahydrofolate dehydrogenase/cyclohydrolase NAD(P)-binding domain-containing protein n=1 Tax=Coptis chinensis TaxID=261450 RepID=A0A835I3F9_9MAGN|nr:hypothetical protein IFM89_012105 [Coptis chinensis]